jgi:hypothetical protein
VDPARHGDGPLPTFPPTLRKRFRVHLERGKPLARGPVLAWVSVVAARCATVPTPSVRELDLMSPEVSERHAQVARLPYQLLLRAVPDVTDDEAQAVFGISVSEVRLRARENDEAALKRREAPRAVAVGRAAVLV